MCSKRDFCDAALLNPCLRRFIGIQICLALGYCGLWQDSELNIDVSENRDDSTDMALALYARPGDGIATADKKLQRALRHVDPEGSVIHGPCRATRMYVRCAPRRGSLLST